MSGYRIQKLLVAIGKKGVGKTYMSMQMMKSYIAGNPAKGTPGRKVLILDANDEYYDIQPIAIEDIGLFSVHPIIEIRRIRTVFPDGRAMTLDDIANTLLIILEKFRGGLIVVEDVSKYISDNMPNDLIGAICTNRHVDNDILIHYQSIGRINPKVWQNINLLRFHKCTDSVRRHKNKFEDKFEYLSIAEYLVNIQYSTLGNERFFVYVDIDREKIFGAFTKSMAEGAVEEFIQENYTTLVNPLLKARDMRGNLVYTKEKAALKVKDRLMSYLKF